MRCYPANSPRAAARVVALTLLADGAVSRGELSGLVRLGIYERLQLDPLQMQDALEDLARELFEFGAPSWDCSGGLHPVLVSCVLADVSDARLREDLLEICHAIAQADSPMTEAEESVLAHVRDQWRLPASASRAHD